MILCWPLLAVWLLFRAPAVPEKPTSKPANGSSTDFSVQSLEVLADGYVASHSCQECHHKEYDSWHSSYHRTMTQAVSPETAPQVLKDSQVTIQGHHYQFEQEGDEFWVEMDDVSEGKKGDVSQRIRRQVVLVTGSHHMHVFWYATKSEGSPGVVPIVYLIAENRWIPRKSAFLKSPELQRSTDTGRWNLDCSKCHTTHPRPRLRSNWSLSQFDTQVVELGIACEACHGPGDGHVAKHRQQPGAPDVDSIVNPKNLDSRRASQVCGQCHSISQSAASTPEYLEHGRRFRPGQDYNDVTRLPTFRFEDVPPAENPQKFFWPDGMVRVSGREYNGLIESPCFQRGKLSCLSCHSLHDSRGHASTKDWADDQLHVGMRGNQACLQCHKDFAADVSAHTHHATSSSGSQCMNCHMPHTTYGLLKAMRSHEIDSPRVETGVKTGRMVACNQCHLDRSLKWTANTLETWYGQKTPDLDVDLRSKSAAVLHTLKGDAGQRVLAAWSFGWKPARDISGTEWMVPYLLTLMNDEYDAVRLVAFKSLRTLPGYENFAFDPFAELAGRSKITKDAQVEWGQKNRQHGQAELLLDSNGQLDLSEFTRLLKERNNRKVYLAE